MKKRFRIKKVLIFLLLLVLGFFYRKHLAFLAEERMVWDMDAYSWLARDILSKGIAANCCNHGVGYPAFVAIFYHFFGVPAVFQIRIAQIIIDLGTSILLYAIAKRSFGQNAAWIVFGLYLINPFT